MRQSNVVIPLLVLVLIALLARAQTEYSGETGLEVQETEWLSLETSPDSMLDPDVLDAAFSEDPYKAANIVDKNPELLDNAEIANRFDKEAQRDVFVLNDNPEAKNRWFAQRGITDEGADVDGYDGTTVILRGKNGENGATIKDIKDRERLDGATVTERGELILRNQARLGEGAEVSFDENGNAIVKGGYADLTYSRDANVQMTGGTVYIDGITYTSASGEPLDVVTSDSSRTVSGRDVLEAGANGETTSVFTGSVTSYTDGHLTIRAGSEYSLYQDGHESRTFTTANDLQYYNEPNKCAGDTTCIEDYADPNDKVGRIHQDLTARSQQDGFDLGQFVSQEMDRFKEDNFVTDPDSENFGLYAEMQQLTEQAQGENFNLNSYLSETAGTLMQKYEGNPDGMKQDPVYRFYEKLQADSSAEGFNLAEYVDEELRNLKIQEFQLRPEHAEDRVYKYLQELEQAGVHDSIELQEYLAANKPNANNIVRVVSGDQNAIRVDNHDSTIGTFQVDRISDESTVVYSEANAVEVTFSKEPPAIQGNPEMLTASISTSFVDETGELHQFEMTDGVVVQCSEPCMRCGDFMSDAERAINRGKQINSRALEESKSAIEKRWGVVPRVYNGVFNEESEKDFASMVFAASDTASQNNYGVRVTPAEVATTMLAEGGILLFTCDMGYVPKDTRFDSITAVSYNNEEYEVQKDAKGNPYIVIGTTKHEITSSAMKETVYIQGIGPYYADHNLAVFGIADLGLDVIGQKNSDGEAEIDRLKRLGYIPDDVEITPIKGIADGRDVVSGNFETLEEGIQVVAGVYAERKKRFMDDYNSLYSQGVIQKPLGQLTDSEVFYWSTVYYNAANPKDKLVSQRGVPASVKDTNDLYTNDYKLNAARRAASYELLKNLIFKK
jgi:hypothetical protein